MRSEKIRLHLLMTLSALISFLVGFYLVNPALHYHYQHIAWLNTHLFFSNYMAFSGGPAEYVALFVSQFFYSKGLGSAIVAISGYLISYFLYQTINFKQGKVNLHYLLIPLVQILVLALMCNYLFPFSITINLIIVSAVLYICKLVSKIAGYSISYHTLIAGVLIYYISGGMYFLIFMSSSLILMFGKPYKISLINSSLIVIEALLIPFISFHYIFLSSLTNSFFRSTPEVAIILRYSRPFLFYIGLASIPSIILMLKLFTMLPLTKREGQPTINKKEKSKGKNGAKFLFRNNPDIVFGTQVIMLFAVSYFILYKNYQPFEKVKVEIDYFASQQEWEKVISMSESLKTYDRMVNFQYNRALTNTGQLLEKLFDYEQLLGSQGLFLDKPFTAEIVLPGSDLYFDLGNIDESQRLAFESQTLMPFSPRVLKRLILNCIILGKYAPAKTYMNVLSLNPMEKEWVKKYSEYINDSKLANANLLITEKRKYIGKTALLYSTPRDKLISQLKEDPLNKAAFENLIAFDLMIHDLTRFIEDMKFLSPLKYDKLPVVMEEAVVMYRSLRPDIELLNRIRIPSSVIERYGRFAKIYNANKRDKEKAKQATLSYKNTYWYYALFLSPVVTNVKIVAAPADSSH